MACKDDKPITENQYHLHNTHSWQSCSTMILRWQASRNLRTAVYERFCELHGAGIFLAKITACPSGLCKVRFKDRPKQHQTLNLVFQMIFSLTQGRVVVLCFSSMILLQTFWRMSLCKRQHATNSWRCRIVQLIRTYIALLSPRESWKFNLGNHGLFDNCFNNLMKRQRLSYSEPFASSQISAKIKFDYKKPIWVSLSKALVPSGKQRLLL